MDPLRILLEYWGVPLKRCNIFLSMMYEGTLAFNQKYEQEEITACMRYVFDIFWNLLNLKWVKTQKKKTKLSWGDSVGEICGNICVYICIEHIV